MIPPIRDNTAIFYHAGRQDPAAKCPRQAGSRKVIEWLKLLENNEQRRAAGQGQQPYDSRWMWDELKLERYRDSV